MTLIKKLCLSAFLAAALAACVSTQEMNAKAYAGYAQMKQQNARAIDTTSSTSRRIHTVFNRMKPYAEKGAALVNEKPEYKVSSTTKNTAPAKTDKVQKALPKTSAVK